MFGRISNTWALMGDSWRILKQDKEMLIFPLLSGICCLIVVASFLIPMWMSDSMLPPDAAMGEQGTVQVDAADQIWYYAKLFMFYVCNYFVIVFFNTALVGCAAMRMRGEDPTVADGFRVSVAKLPSIFGWSLVAATVGMILRIIEDKSEWLGRLVAGILGLAWTMVSYLVIPVMVIEGKSPISALKDSASLLKRTWGEQIVGNFSFGMIFFLLGLPIWILIGLAVFLWQGAGSVVLAGSLIVIGVIAAILLSLIQSALSVIFQTALYFYAKEGTAPAGFNNAAMQQAIRQR